MSVTFGLPAEFRSVTSADWDRVLGLPCPECGGHDPYGGVKEPHEADADCNSCMGMGGDWPQRNALEAREQRDDGEFNVSNANARYIVRELLGLGAEDVHCGSIGPTTVLMRTTHVEPARGAVAPSESRGVHITSEGVGPGCRVIDMGRSAGQCASYVTRLRRLAEIAIERGAPSITWG